MYNGYIKNQELFSKPIIMNKNILRNSEYLEKLGRRAKGEATPKVGKILTLYNLRKIFLFIIIGLENNSWFLFKSFFIKSKCNYFFKTKSLKIYLKVFSQE